MKRGRKFIHTVCNLIVRIDIDPMFLFSCGNFGPDSPKLIDRQTDQY
uniref:Uncharacterized protein n=1 Tax=Rhizophora mucronata TaxID=61149 RepID=A0A2P2J0I8_RHIMU